MNSRYSRQDGVRSKHFFIPRRLIWKKVFPSYCGKSLSLRATHYRSTLVKENRDTSSYKLGIRYEAVFQNG